MFTYRVSSKAPGIVLFLLIKFLCFQKVTCNNTATSTATSLTNKTESSNSLTQNTTDDRTDNTSNYYTSTVQPSGDIIHKIQPFIILGGVAILLLLLIVNFVSVVQRRKNHRALQGYLLSLHTLVPLLRNYDDIPDRPYGGGRKMSKQQVIEEYDEIGLCKRLSEIRNSKKTEDRNTVYSLQKEIFSSNL